MFYHLLQILVIGLALLLGVENLWAQSLSIGLSKYQKGDIAGAESALNKALHSTQPRAEKAKITMLLGVVLYTKGDKPGAERSFRNALALDPQSSINPNETLDPTVQDFFQKIKSGSGGSQPGPSTAPLAPGARPQKKTLLKVVSSVTSAQVSIEGILAGAVNELINTDPGKTQIEVSAPGYQTIQMTINVIENQENVVSIKFEKIRPKKKPPSREDRDTFAAASPYALGGTPPPKSKPKKSIKNPGKSRPKSNDLFEEAEKSRPAKGRSSERDLAKEFEMDAATSTYPQPSYTPPPAYPAPYSAPAYPNNYPPPAYNYPPPQSYPPPQAAPPQPDYGPPPSYNSAARAPYYREPAGEIRGLSLLPLGVGQFAQSRYLVGLLFLTSEIGTGYMYYSIGQENQQFAESANQYLRDFCTPKPNEELTPQAITDCSEYQSESQTYIKKRKGEQQIYLIATIGLAVAGIIEAIVWDTSEHDIESPKSPVPTRKKKIKKRKYKGFSLYLEPTYPSHDIESNVDIRATTTFTWRF